MSMPKGRMRWCMLGLFLFTAPTPPSLAHTLKSLEQKLKSKERYAQIVNRPAPEFTLQNAAGASVRLSDYRGKVVVLWFVYSTCTDVCPLHSEALASIQDKINRTPMRGLVQFVAITTDPVRDLPPVLKTYGPKHGLDSLNWVMLTSGPGKAAATRDLAKKYGLEFTLGKDGYQMHGVVTHLVDKSGNLRARYHGLKFNPTNMIVHINALTNDHH